MRRAIFRFLMRRCICLGLCEEFTITTINSKFQAYRAKGDQ